MEERRRERNWTMQVTALYDYEPEQPDELGFGEGDVLRVVHVQDDGWWSGYNVENVNVVGLFPSNYVQAQRTPISPQNKNTVVDVVTTPRPPGSSRRHIQQERQPPDTPELSDEEGDEVPELRSEYRGHIGTVLQLRKNLQEAERASEAARDARQQAEQEKMRYSKSWRDAQEKDENDLEEEINRDNSQVPQMYRQQGDNEDGDDEASAYPQRQGYMHENDAQDDEESGVDRSSEGEENNGVQHQAEQGQDAGTAEAENAAATLIARGYRHHSAMVHRNRETEHQEKQRRLNEAAAVAIQRWAAHAYFMQRERRLHETEKTTARLVWERENEAAGEIQKWIRLQWACFWRRRVRADREERAAKEADEKQQREDLKVTQRLQAEIEEQHHRQRELEEEQRRKSEEEKHRQTEYAEVQRRQRAAEEEEEKRQSLQRQAVEDDQRYQLERNAQEKDLRQHLQKNVEQEVRRRIEQEVGVEVDQHDNESVVSSSSPQTLSPAKPRRKVMKKEAVDLIKTLVHQQLDETLRDHDAKMDELQRMVTKLQTVVRKQTVMLQDSTDQLTSLQMPQLERQPIVPPRNNVNNSGSFLPRIGSQTSTIPRQPLAPSGLRAPRPVMLSKLPVLGNSGQGSSNQLTTKKR